MTRHPNRERESGGAAEELLEAKRQLRGGLRRQRGQWAAEQAAVAASRACDILASCTEFERFKAVAFYCAIDGELDVHPAFVRALERGKHCFLPRCTDSQQVEFVEVMEWESLRSGRYGIREPVGEAEGLPSEGALVLVPGVAFDRDGNRLGMGRGYYDRTFGPGAFAGSALMGVGFDWQLVDRVPKGPTDRGMDFILTERGVLRARNARE